MMTINPWELSKKVTGVSIPNLVKSKYVVVKLTPPKEKSIRDGLVLTALMLNYTDEAGNVINTIEYDNDKIEFPFGKKSLVATKFRGPLSYYKWKDQTTGDPFAIDNSSFTEEAAREYLSGIDPKTKQPRIKDWEKLDSVAQNSYIDDYFQDMYLFGLSKDLDLPDTEKDEEIIVPTIGMVTNFYRIYTPPSKGEKYGNIIITKWKRPLDNLDGSFTMMDSDLALKLYEAYRTKEEISFDPESFDVI